jgi:Lipocalin-like domain
MRMLKPIAFLIIGTSFIVAGPAEAEPPNKVLGTWRMVSAQLDPDGRNVPAYGPAPSSLLVFTADMHVIEVLTDSTIPKFASNARGHGTAEENQAAMAGSIGWFGAYTVDENGELSGDRVEGSTFPNWVGDVRTRKDIQVVVDGDRMAETFVRPEGTKIVIIRRRVRWAPRAPASAARYPLIRSRQTPLPLSTLNSRLGALSPTQKESKPSTFGSCRVICWIGSDWLDRGAIR